MPIFVLSVGGYISLTQNNVDVMIKSAKFPWKGRPIIFRNMDAFDFEKYENKYDSGYMRYSLNRTIMESDFRKAEKLNIPYVVFTNDVIVFNICRVLTRKTYDKPENKYDACYGGWFIVTKYNERNVKVEFESYPFDRFGRLEWPEKKENDLMVPFEILLSELL